MDVEGIAATAATTNAANIVPQDAESWPLPYEVIRDLLTVPLVIDCKIHVSFYEDVYLRPIASNTTEQTEEVRARLLTEPRTNLVGESPLIGAAYREVIIINEEDISLYSIHVNALVSSLLLAGNMWRRCVNDLIEIPPTLLMYMVRHGVDLRQHFAPHVFERENASAVWLNNYLCQGILAIQNDAVQQQLTFTTDDSDDSDESQSEGGNDARSSTSSAITNSTISNMSILTLVSAASSNHSIVSRNASALLGHRMKYLFDNDPLRGCASPIIAMTGLDLCPGSKATKSSFSGVLYCVIDHIMTRVAKSIRGVVRMRGCRTCVMIGSSGGKMKSCKRRWFDQVESFYRADTISPAQTIAYYWKIRSLLAGDFGLWSSLRNSATLCIICNALYKLAFTAALYLARENNMSLPYTEARQIALVPLLPKDFEHVPIDPLWQSISHEFRYCEYMMPQYLTQRGIVYSDYDINVLVYSLSTSAATVAGGRGTVMISWDLAIKFLDTFAVTAYIMNHSRKDELRLDTDIKDAEELRESQVYGVSFSGTGEMFRISTPYEYHISNMASKLMLMMMELNTETIPFARTMMYPLFLRNYFRGDRKTLSLAIRWFARLFFAPTPMMQVMGPEDSAVDQYRMLHVILGSLDTNEMLASLLSVYKERPGPVMTETEFYQRSDGYFELCEEQYAYRRSMGLKLSEIDHAHLRELDARIMQGRFNPVTRESFLPEHNPQNVVMSTTRDTIYTSLIAFLFPRCCRVFVRRQMLIDLWQEIMANEELWSDHVELVALMFQMRNLEPAGTRKSRNWDRKMFDETIPTCAGRYIPCSSRANRGTTTRWFIWLNARTAYVNQHAFEHMPALRLGQYAGEWCTCADCRFIKYGHHERIDCIDSLVDPVHAPTLEQFVRQPLHPSKAVRQIHIPHELSGPEVRWSAPAEELVFHPKRTQIIKDCVWTEDGQYFSVPAVNVCYPAGQLPPHYLFYRYAADPRTSIETRRLIFNSLHGVPFPSKGGARDENRVSGGGMRKFVRVNKLWHTTTANEMKEATKHAAQHARTAYATPSYESMRYTGPDVTGSEIDLQPGGLLWESFLETVQRAASNTGLTPEDRSNYAQYCRWYNDNFPPLSYEMMMNPEITAFANIGLAAMTLEATAILPYKDDPVMFDPKFLPHFYGNGVLRRDVTHTAIIGTFDLPNLRQMTASTGDIAVGFMSVDGPAGTPAAEVITLGRVFPSWRRKHLNYYERQQTVKRTNIGPPVAFTHADPRLITVMHALPVERVLPSIVYTICDAARNRNPAFGCHVPNEPL